MKTGQTRPFLGFSKKSSTLPLVVWAEESIAGLRFDIRPSYEVAPTRSQLVTDGQSNCTKITPQSELVSALVGTLQLGKKGV